MPLLTPPVFAVIGHSAEGYLICANFSSTWTLMTLLAPLVFEIVLHLVD